MLDQFTKMFCIEYLNHRVKIQKKTNICVYRRDLNCSREYIVYILRTCTLEGTTTCVHMHSIFMHI
jgi:hypothetical protein